METEAAPRNGITFKNFQDSVKIQMISTDKQDTHLLQV